jgi:chaperonin GroEL (HSP60 family)
MEKLDIIEPIVVKEQIIKSATETANMLLRIDNVIAVSKSGSPTPPDGSGMGMY